MDPHVPRRVQILRVRQAPVLLHVAGRPKPVMVDAEVKHETPETGLRLEIVLDLNIAAPLARAGRHALLYLPPFDDDDVFISSFRNNSDLTDRLDTKVCPTCFPSQS